MKKILFIAFTAFALVSCGPKTTQERIAAFEDKYQAIVDDYRTAMEALSEDDEAAMESVYTKTMESIHDLCMTTIKKNPSDSVALVAFQEVQFQLSDDEVEKVINSLSSTMQETDFIQSVKTSLVSKKATAEGMKFIDFTVVQDPEDAENTTVKLSDYVGNGKYVLVDFWASWCGPCKQELPYIADVYEKYHGDNFNVLSVAVWDEVEDTKAAAPELGIVWDQIINAQKEPTDIYGIDGIPHLILFAPDGTILKRGDKIRATNLEPTIREALGL